MSPSIPPPGGGGRTNPYMPPDIMKIIDYIIKLKAMPPRIGGFDPEDRPAAPTNVTLSLLVREHKTRLEFRAKVSCDDLTPDTCQADIKRFVFQIRPTNAGGTPQDGTNVRTKEITARKAFDSDGDPHVIFNNIEKPRTWYWQARARILDNDERFSNWSAWTSPQLPVQTALPKPPAPTGVDLDFFSNVDRNHNQRWRGRVRWNEVVNWDVPGGDKEEDMARYIVQVQVSDDGLVGDDNIKKFVVEAKDDDADTTNQVIWDVRHRRWWFRARVRSVDRWNRRGDFSAWTIWQRPGQEVPPNATDVTIYDDGVDQVTIDWDPPPDPNNPDRIHIDVAYYQAQIAQNPNFSPLYKFDRRQIMSKKSFFIKKADRKNKIYYCRMRTANGDDEFGPWISARINGNSNPGADPEGVKIRGPRYTMAFTINGAAQAKFYKQVHPVPEDSRIVKAMIRAGDHDAATHPNDGCPTGSALEANFRVWNEDDTASVPVFDADSRLKIPAGKHKDTIDLDDSSPNWNRQHVVKREAIGFKIATIGSTNPGSDIVAVLWLEPE